MESVSSLTKDSVVTSGKKVETVQIVVPIYNEGPNLRILYDNLLENKIEFDSLKFVYDFDEDISLPFIAEISAIDSRVLAEKNEYGRGVINALKWGFAHVTPGPVLVLMGDNSDKLSIIPEMLQMWRDGSKIVSPSRYMKGGEQHHGELVKGTLSMIAGKSLNILGFPTADATNNFKLYDGAWLRKQKIESVAGFEVAIELCCKAYQQKEKITELPTEWFDRTFGESNFRLFYWLPHYLKWYLLSLKTIIQRKFSK